MAILRPTWPPECLTYIHSAAHPKDERNNTTTYAYDDYKRRISITAPPAYAGDPLPRTTYLYSDKAGGAVIDYRHAAPIVGRVVTPLGNIQTTVYDNDFWKRSETAGTGAETSKSTFTYDAVGNLKTVKDPAGQSSGLYTEYFYDKRNRLLHIRDPILANRNSLGYTTSWVYDLAGNKKSQQRANNQMTTYDKYDARNRLEQQTVQRDLVVLDVMKWTYHPAGTLKSFEDARGKIYSYTYDFLNRRRTATYPADSSGIARVERWDYDLANDMQYYTNRAGAVQTFTYDNRNRQRHFVWDQWTPNRFLLIFSGTGAGNGKREG